MPVIQVPIKHRAYATKTLSTRHPDTGEEFVYGIEKTDWRTGRTCEVEVKSHTGRTLFSWKPSFGPLPVKEFNAAVALARKGA